MKTKYPPTPLNLVILTLLAILFLQINARAADQCLDLFENSRADLILRIDHALKTDIRLLPRKWLDSLERESARNFTAASINYIRNVTQAVFAPGGFRSWLKGESPLSFADFLRQQHVDVVYGRSLFLQNWYFPYLVTAANVKDMVQPGLLRSDSKYKRNELAEFIMLQKNNFDMLLSDKEIDALMAAPVGQRTRIDGIPEAAQTVNLGFFKPGDLFMGEKIAHAALAHRYADAKYIPIYIARMEMTMLAIRKLYFEPRTPENTLAIVKLLAHYHQLFINALPFGRVNNSIAMGHINYLLIELGLNPVTHGDLDFVALVVSSARYENIFIEWVRDHQ